jgi:hypothetical protein
MVGREMSCRLYIELVLGACVCALKLLKTP